MCFPTGNQNIVNAYDVNIPQQFTRVKSIKYPEWWRRKCPSISKQWSTVMCKYKDNWSYCLEASKHTPVAGAYTSQVIENNVMVRKLLYYGFGGPGASDANGGLDGNPNDGKGCGALTDDGLGYEETAYLYTHVLLSLAYSGDLCGANMDELESLGIGLKGLYSYISSLPEPSKASFNGQTRATFKATFDKTTKSQKTNTVSFDGGSNSTINIPLQSNVTLHNVSTGTSQTGGTVVVHGGQSFYFTAPCKNSPTNYKTGNIAGENCARFTALAIVPGGDKQTHGSWAMDPAYLDLNINWLDFGSIEINKTNTNKDLIDGAEFNLKSTSYDGYNENVTVKNGKIIVEDLLVGTYQLKELNAPDGYLLNTDTFTITVEKDKTTVQTVMDQEPTGKIELQKEIDTSRTNGLLGDANAKDVTFKLYAKEKIMNKAGTVKFYDKDEVVSISKTDESGKIIWDNLPLGKYYIQESKSNNSLVINDEKINVSIDYEGQTVSKVSRDAKGTNRVNKQKIQVFKSGEKDGISGLVKGLQGAEFTFRLKSEVDHVGWDNATVYAVITTDSNGKANTPYLPYGKYIVRETKTPKDYITAPDFMVSITDDYTEYKDVEQVKRININNRPFTSQLKIIKVDKETGKTVTLNGASFKIKDAQGNYVTQKVSGKKYDTFTTNSKNVVTIKDTEEGTVTLPLQLDAGTYTIEEIKTPKGFLDLDNPIQFTITNTRDYDKDEDEDPILTIKVKNAQPKAEIKINKTIIDLDTDKDLVDRSDLSKIQFVLKAKDDIYSSIDGSLLFKKDQNISLKESKATLLAGKEIKDGLFALSNDGHLKITNLPMSYTDSAYYLQEVKTIDGCVLDSKKYDVTFKQTDTKTQLYSKTFNIENKTTHFEFNKTDITGDKEVAGATLTIKDDQGNVVDEWISNDKAHSIEGLIVGKTYTLTETITANDYVKATDIIFTVKNSSELETVTMKDKQVAFSKTDITGENEIEGATITVSEKQSGKVVDEWVSEKKKHLINGLEEGKSYILSEKISPEEFVKSSDIEFTVTKEKINQKIIMKDKQVSISKSTVSDKEVVGALMQIIDEGGNVVDEWTSEGKVHFANNLEEGKSYILHEDLSPLGLNLANDIEFEVTYDKENQKVEMIDTINDVSKVKEDGKQLKGAELTVVSNKTKQIVDRWTTGQHIFDVTEDMQSQIKENKKAEGMYIDEDDSTITYSISKNKDRDDYKLVFVKDGTTTYANIDLNGDETSHMIEGLIAGEEYVLRETKTPNGYATSKEQTFKAEENNDTSLTMIDEDIIVQISKQDITSKKEIEGAKLKVVDKDGNIIDEWTSKKEAHMIKNLNVGESYRLIEETAPQGYKIAESIEFKIEDTGAIQHVVMYDEHLPVKVKTGDDNSYQYWIVSGLLSLVALLIIRFKVKREHQ
ncbi:hypothetical protein L0P58_11885 [Faecalibacillus intestinalis]|uniref:Uncharacterized protein n=2 Tax=Faecalibacillus TaxID=2678885 RepID=A0AAW4VK64_9FIRM|nr:SpaA isopeptide-forming pilin-related protein [Faecalibacillus intestinalis]MCB8562702.1 hypothetical protein [Faecalibacillus intestinalis]MCG4810841.1 hypothetical protein [Faecalibacillus intestinalis]